MALKKEDWGGIAILAAVIAIVAALFFFAPTSSPNAYRPVEETGSALTVTAPKDEAGLHDIHVDATLKAPGFIVFHEAIGDAPGPVAGESAYLQAGEYHDLVIHLVPALAPDSDFFGLIFKDDGNKTYDPGVDLPVMSDGKTIKAGFTTSM